MTAITATARSRKVTPGVVIAGVLAAILTVMDIVVLRGYEIDAVWIWLQLPVVALAWTAPFAWSRRRWGLAGVCLLAMLGGLWGYFYLPPLAAVALAAVAFWRAARGVT